MCGGLAVISDVPKTQVFALARHLNKDGIAIPENTIEKPPSAELRPDQKDSDSLPEYDVLDAILHAYVEEGKSISTLLSSGFDERPPADHPLSRLERIQAQTGGSRTQDHSPPRGRQACPSSKNTPTEIFKTHESIRKLFERPKS